MNSISLIGLLPDEIVLWVQYGTRLFVDYLYILVGIPLIVDLLIVLTSRFGIRLNGEESGESESTQSVSSGGLGTGTIALDETYKFMYVYARNPALFSGKQGTASLDSSLAQIQRAAVGTDSTDTRASLATAAGGGESKKSAESETSNVRSRPLLTTFVMALHGICLAGILAVNVIGYMQYSNLFHKYYTLTKYGYNLKYAELERAPRDEHDEALSMEPFIEILNDVKYSTVKSK